MDPAQAGSTVLGHHPIPKTGDLVAKRTNYKQEKRLKELDKQKRKDAKKERKLEREQTREEGSTDELFVPNESH